MISYLAANPNLTLLFILYIFHYSCISVRTEMSEFVNFLHFCEFLSSKWIN